MNEKYSIFVVSPTKAFFYSIYARNRDIPKKLNVRWSNDISSEDEK